MYKNTTYLLSILIISISFFGCKKQGCMDPTAINYDSSAKKEDNSCVYDNSSTDFDKKAMLENIANNYITPAFNNYRSYVIKLDSMAEVFTTQPTEQGLSELRNLWLNTTLSWQDVALFDFGAANYILLKSQTNAYPADSLLIENHITSGTWNLDWSDNYDAKGLQGLDYLLNKRGLTESEKVIFLTGTQNSKDYLNAITDDLLNNINYAHDGWSTGVTDFINDYESNSDGSSISTLVNAMCLHYEFYVRRGKVGLPLGVFNAFSQTEMPEIVECFHYGQSLPFAKRAVESLRDYINGVHYSTKENGIGLDDYMDFVGATANNENLSAVINSQIDNILSDLNTLNDPFSSEIMNNKPQVQTTYETMQNLVPLIKVDMTSALGVLITYADNDGD